MMRAELGRSGARATGGAEGGGGGFPDGGFLGTNWMRTGAVVDFLGMVRMRAPTTAGRPCSLAFSLLRRATSSCRLAILTSF